LGSVIEDLHDTPERQAKTERINALGQAIQAVTPHTDWDKTHGCKQKIGEDPRDYLERLREVFELHSGMTMTIMDVPLKLAL